MSTDAPAASAVAGGAPVRGWRAAFPPAQWLPTYQASWLPRDAIAGVTLAAYGIPVSLAYASLAGLPPQYGVYGYLVGGLAYALFGSSRQLAIGPTSAISLMVGVTVAGMAGGNPGRWAEIAAVTALVTAVMCVLAWILRLSSLVNFISETILLGFKAGAALTIATTQLPKLFGVKGGGEGFFERLGVLWGQLPSTNLTVLGFGLAAILVLLLGEKFLPGRPVALVVVAVSILLLSVTSLGELGFKVVGALPRGLPHFEPPGLRPREVDGLIPLAFACLLLSYVESVSAARALAQAHRQEIDPRQELLGLGAANLAAALFQSYPLAGGLSQSSVNDKAGARTPLSLVFASVTIGVCLMFLTGMLANLPNVVLAAIVLVAVKGLINVRELRHLWNVSRWEFAVSMAAFAAVLVLGILKGVMVAVVVSLLLLLRRASHPHVAFLGRIPGTRNYSDLERSPDNEPIPGVLIVRMEASLLYFNVEHVREAIREGIRSATGPLRLVLIDLSSSPVVDVAGARMLAGLQEELGAAGVPLRLVGARASARDILRAERLEEQVGAIDRRLTVADVVDELQRSTPARLPA
ncbi:MAG TPA: SulP family inorganic anion transporter [Myxococcaceae bacterium]|nr:SulP family inorganic anion transporter [Myxococcaceae bacterium]